MHYLLEAITFLKTHGLRGASVIRGYHARRVVPLMERVLPLYRMTLAQGMLHDSEVTQRIKEATWEANDMFLISSHPMMWSDAGFIELLAGLVFWDSIVPLLEYMAVRVANRAMDEQRKKKKDDEEKNVEAASEATAREVASRFIGRRGGGGG